jgi:hypothetical protein
MHETEDYCYFIRVGSGNDVFVGLCDILLLQLKIVT